MDLDLHRKIRGPLKIRELVAPVIDCLVANRGDVDSLSDETKIEIYLIVKFLFFPLNLIR